MAFLQRDDESWLLLAPLLVTGCALAGTAILGQFHPLPDNGYFSLPAIFAFVVISFLLFFLYSLYVQSTASRVFTWFALFPTIYLLTYLLSAEFGLIYKLSGFLVFSVWLGLFIRYIKMRALFHAYLWVLGLCGVMLCFLSVAVAGLLTFTISMGNSIVIIGLAPQFLGALVALPLRSFWLSHLRPRAVSRGMSTRNIRFVEFYAPIIIAIAVFLSSLIYSTDSF